LNLLISSFVYFPETIGSREHDLASGLVKLGYDVFVITGLPSYPTGVVYNGYNKKANKWEVLDGVNIYRLPYVGERGRSSVKRVFSFILFSLLSLTAVFSQNLKPDVVRANQLGLPGYLISKFKRVPLYLEVQDMWPEWSKTSNFSIGNLLYKILDWQQRKIYQSSYKITTISKRFKKHLESKGVTSKKINIISNWASSNSFRVVPKDLNLGIKEGFIDKFNIMYAGNIGSAQGIDILIKSANIINENPDIKFVVIGEGLEKDDLEKQAKNLKLKNIRFLGKKSPEELVEYLAWADLLFLPLRKDPVYEVTIPSKTFTYLACGRPILASANGAVADLISELDVGIVVPPEDPESVTLAIQEFMMKDKKSRELLGINARLAHEKYFDPKILIQNYDQLFKS
jgi:glycosyltransferase involved in cell wall biosynthesis